MRNAVRWFEIIGKDASALHKFYSEVFDWKLTPPVAEMGNYSMLAEQGPNDKGAGGGIGGDPNEGNRVSVYVEVDDPQKYLDRAAKAGATVLMPVTVITPHTTIAMFRDPAGNTTGIMKANPRPATTRKKTTARKPATRKKTTARKATARKKTARRGRRR
jgi:uncharacterized protein